MKKLLFFVLSQILFFSLTKAQRLDSYPIPHPAGYVCYRASDNMVIDGKLDEKSWQDAEWTSDFKDIEGDKKSVPYFKTHAKMLWDDNYLYIAAELEEKHIWGYLKKRDTVIFYDNDFEVFIDPNGDNHLYYEYEMNALNTVWDLMLVKPYRDGGPAINSWDISGLLSGVQIYGTINNPSDEDDKWTLEIAFPWSVLEEAASHRGHPNDGEQWRISFSRVEWEVDVEGSLYKKRVDENDKRLPENNWTWPSQGKINMHRPETWGYVQFTSKSVGNQKVAFQKDPFFDLKMALMEVYYQQKDFYRKHNVYSKELEELNLSSFNKENFGKEISIEVMSNHFVAIVKKGNVVWSVNEESKLICRKP